MTIGRVAAHGTEAGSASMTQGRGTEEEGGTAGGPGALMIVVCPGGETDPDPEEREDLHPAKGFAPGPDPEYERGPPETRRLAEKTHNFFKI